MLGSGVETPILPFLILRTLHITCLPALLDADCQPHILVGKIEESQTGGKGVEILLNSFCFTQFFLNLFFN